MSCPFLERRRRGDEREFETPRAYCTAMDAFVAPVRADICVDRFDFEHAVHCEIFRDATDGEKG